MSKKSKRKTSLKSAILLLLLMAILLVTSSYAWFTANQTVTISSLQVNVKASNGLQISTDGKTWKSIITQEDIKAGYAGHTNNIPTEMAPVSTTGTVTNGNLDMYYGSVVTNTAGDFILTAEKDADDKGHYIVFDVFLKVDAATDVYMTEESKVEYAGANTQGLENAARVGFIIEGNTAATSGINTITGLSLDDGTAKIWEPNYDTHSALAITNAKTNYDLTITSPNAEALTYYGVKAPIVAGDNIPIKQVGTPSVDYFSAVTPAIKTVNGSTLRPKFDKLESGITKVRIYMWVEGQDVDCENGASGTDIKYTVQFSTKETA